MYWCENITAVLKTMLAHKQINSFSHEQLEEGEPCKYYVPNLETTEEYCLLIKFSDSLSYLDFHISDIHCR